VILNSEENCASFHEVIYIARDTKTSANDKKTFTISCIWNIIW